MGEVEWGRLKAGEIRALAAKDAVVIVPVASLEQHGPHLPTATDTLLVSEVARRAAVLAGERHPIVVTPCVWTGLSEHHMELGGTVTLDFNAFAGLLRGIVESLVRQGFERICLLNGHGGNSAALRTITDELTFEFEIPIVSGTYWHVAAAALEPILERQRTIRHACEAESSMVMAIAPELVDTSRLAEADRPGAGVRTCSIAGAALPSGRARGRSACPRRRRPRKVESSSMRRRRRWQPASSIPRPGCRAPRQPRFC